MPEPGLGQEVVGGGAPPDGLFGAVVDISDDAIVTCDDAGTITTWGTAAERLFGHRAADVLGQPFDTLVPAHLRPELQEVLATAAAGDQVRHFESEVLRPDGLPVPVSFSLNPVPDAGQGRPVVVVVGRDVTEQHLAQATLAEMEARLEEGEALAHVGSWLWDLRTGAVQWSAELHRIHGVDPLEFGGTFESHLTSIHPSDRDRVGAAMHASVVAERPFAAEYRVVRPDGEIRVVRARAQPTMGSTGRPVGLRGIGQDVTDRALNSGSPGS